MAESRAKASGNLNTSDRPSLPAVPLTVAGVGDKSVTGRFPAVINAHDCNLNQIEVAIQNNLHEVDPHPNRPGEYLLRHPIYLVCFDPSSIDEDGRPAAGKPAELNLELIRQVFSARYAHVSESAPPEDGSHIQVDGMHVIAELDHAGRPTGRVRFGNPDEVQG